MSHRAGIYSHTQVIRVARHGGSESAGLDATTISGWVPELASVSVRATPMMVRRSVDGARLQMLTGEGLRMFVYGGGPIYNADILKAVYVMRPQRANLAGKAKIG